MPGFARAIFAMIGPLFFKTIPQGTATQILLATSPKVEGVSGKYFADCHDASSKLSGYPKNDDGKELWTLVEKIVAGL